MSNDGKISPVSAEQWKQQGTRVIMIPSDEPDSPDIAVRVKKISFLALMEAGKLPNTLLPLIYKAMGQGGKVQAGQMTPEQFQQYAELLSVVCREAMVEPRYDEVADVMSDNQKTAVFTYATAGLDALRSFREQLRPTAPVGRHGS